MKKIMLSLVALAAVSSAALAERSYDLRESDTYFGKYAQPSTIERLKPTASDDANTILVNPAASVNVYDREQRRIDEKNDSNSKR